MCIDCVLSAYSSRIGRLLIFVEPGPLLRCAVSTARYFRKRTIEQFYTKRRQVGIGDDQSIRQRDIFRANWGLPDQFIANGFAASIGFSVEGKDVGDESDFSPDKTIGGRLHSALQSDFMTRDFDVHRRGLWFEGGGRVPRVEDLARRFSLMVPRHVVLPVFFGEKIKCFHPQFPTHAESRDGFPFSD